MMRGLIANSAALIMRRDASDLTLGALSVVTFTAMIRLSGQG